MLDVIIAADFAAPGDTALRALFECRAQKALGLATGLLHLGAEGPPRPLSADIQRAVREKLAVVVDPAQPVEARLLVVHAPMALGSLSPLARQGLAALSAETVCLIHDRAPVPADMWRLFGLLRGRVIWVPTNRFVRAELTALGLPVPMEEIDWRPPVIADADRPAPRARTGRLTIGLVDFGGRRHWPETAEALAVALPRGVDVDITFHGRPPGALVPKMLPPNWRIIDRGDMGLDGFLERIDALVYAPSPANETVPDAAIGAALAKGRLVVTRPHLRLHLGEGPLYCEPEAMAETLAAALAGPELPTRLEQARQAGALAFPPLYHAERLSRLLGRTLAPARPAVITAPSPPRVLFLPSNGVGLGHVTRLLAIANRAENRFRPVFASHAQALPILRGFGHHADYIPSLSDTAADPRLWDRWLRVELEQLIHAHDAQAVVFDGNNPAPGLVGAALSQPPCKLVWVRRGMNRIASPHLDAASEFDLIIEPGEIAAERDTGPTAARRHEALQVPPITLLDAGDLSDRDSACRALGLDPARPAVLVQLGAGAHRDVIQLIDAVVRVLKGFPGLQIAIAEWTNSRAPLSLWPDTLVVSGFPLSRHARAFDFSISAAGYNSFHEAIAFGLPTIFLAADHPALDDQRARAGFAQDKGAGFDLAEDQLTLLPSICAVLLDRRAREVMAQNCAALARPNGAAEAATAIAGLWRTE
ncbi:hypothetical protein SAMN02983003_0097 [Devosia enhydra]|uniref:UDP-N-acetylglucosamine:LPS N-acetylglucosamine transferase n=1 Tax=Devosia enhydra TaxID=665118 RepID=A0A1K2HSH9_9HYPH|nr:hypothetical protein [Devosia enhydra]SFZ80740.1 hypothetical protein SAMN02983003_0097 [Devosia enhydra]